jgi:hypothetical protein
LWLKLSCPTGPQVARKAHGFGTQRMTNQPGTVVSGDKFHFHHGQFKAGKRHGFGACYAEEGIFMGGCLVPWLDAKRKALSL